MKRSITLVAACLLLVAAYFLSGNKPGPDQAAAPRSDAGSGAGASQPDPHATSGDLRSRQDSGPSPAAGNAAASPPSQAGSATVSADSKPPRRSIPITVEQVKAMVNGPASVSFPLPDGRTAQGALEIQKRGPLGEELGVTGKIVSPANGRFNFYLEAPEANRGPISGSVVIDHEEVAFSVQPGPGGSALLTELPVDLVICRSYAPPPPGESAIPEESLPSEYPTSVGIPAYQNGVIPLQSNPGVTRVIYLDFDGEKGPFDGWGNFDAAPSGASNTTIKDVWVRVCEDYAPFNVNITTDLQVFLNAPSTSRQRIIITPTTDAAPGAGGVAYLNEYGSTSGRPCWSFYSSGKNSAEVIAHEVGHTLNLSHDGRSSPAEAYYLGHGTDPVGWAPIMGAGYYKNLSQWSKGEYLSANNTQDDLAIIAGKLTYRTDDAGADHATAANLEIFSSGTVDTEGVITRGTTSPTNNNDVDAFKFTTTGGSVNLTIADASTSPNLDISASLYDSANNLILTNNPDTGISATLSTTLAAGDYTVRVDGVGRGDVLVDGYSDYGSLGQYTITGTIAGAVVPDRFSVAENSAAGTTLGTVTPDLNHSGATLTYAIASGNTGNALAINSATGQITVATPSALNFESLSSSWLVPAALELSVTVTDSLNSALNETLRVVVTVTDVNEAPSLAGNTSIVALSNTVAGTALGTFTGSDPDRFDLPTYSIVSGNSAGKFSINSSTGVLSVAGSLDASVQSSYTLTLRATDRGSPALTADLTTTITILPCSSSFTPGYVRHTLYEGITGSTVSSLTSSAAFPSSPTREIRLTEFNDTTRGDNYGSTIRAWMIAPYTGTYQFWLSADAAAELHLNTAGATAPLTLATSLTTASAYQTWNAQSTTYSLTAGQVCYLEARHKESTSSDHLSVAWQIKDSTNTTTIVPREVIPGRYLSPHDLAYTATNAVAASTGFVYEIWDNLTGTSLGTLTSSPNFPNKPDRAIDLTGFTTNYIPAGDNYGARIRAYLTPRTTGTYYFSIAGDDATSLLLSSDSNPANAVQIASNTTATGYEAWTTNASQTSAATSLTAGVRYYLEARVKEATGSDHLAVSWTGPNITSNEIIPYSTNNASDSTLVPYDSNIPPSFGASSYSFSVASNYTLESTAGTVSATDASFDTVRYLITSDNSGGRFAINPSTGAIRVVGTLGAGALYTLQVTAQDSGHGGRFTPKSSTVPVSIQAPGTNTPPQILTSPLALGTFPAGQALSASVASAVSDPGDTLTFSLVSAPSWLSISASGTLDGTPDFNQFGPWTLTYSVSDGVNAAVQATATLTVGNPPNGSPTILPASSATANLINGSVFSGSPANASTSDNTYLTLRETNGNPSILECRWTFSTPPNTPVTLNLEAYQTSSSDNDNFQFAVSTDGGSTFTNAILVTKTTDDNTAQTYSFTSGGTGSTLIRVLDTNRSGASNRDSLFIDLLSLSISANTTPTVADASFNVSSSSAIGTAIGTVSASAQDAGQTLSYSIPRGNEAGLFAISASGVITVNASIPANSGPYALIVVATDNGTPALAGYGTVTVNIASSIPAALTLGNLTPTYNGSPQAVTATTNPPGLAVAITYNGSATVPTNAGSYAISATIVDPVYSGTATATQVIGKATATVSFGSLGQTYNGSPKSVTTTTSPSGLTVGLTYNGSATAPTNAGSYAVVGTINDTNYQGSGTATLVISKATATITLGSLSQTYSGSPKYATAVTSPSGLTVGLTYNGSATGPTNAGSYAIAATINDTNYQGSTTGTLVITKAAATITLGGLSQTYSGSPKSATATTSPAGLGVALTYDGSATAPTNAGSYAVSATVSDPNYTGSTTGTLVISKATAGITLSGLSATYDGGQKLVSATTTPSGLTVGFTYNGSSTAPTDAGTYTITATVNDPNYSGTATGSLVVAKAAASVTLGSLSATYDGSAKPASASTTPAGLSVSLTYNGSATQPVNAGSYTVVATITETNYAGSASGTLLISPAAATLTLGNLSQTYDGSPKPVSATTSPSGLSTTITYNGSSTAPTHAGTYAVSATITDPNHSGSATGSLVIGKATATVSLSGLAQTYDGSSRSVAATTSPAGLQVAVTYDGSPVPPVAAGTYAVAATITDDDHQGSASGSLIVGKASATITLGSLSATYDGSPKTFTASTTPPGLDVQLTYQNGAPPTNAGSYAVSATVTDPNHEGSASGSLVIDKAAATVTLSGLAQSYDGSPKPVSATTVPAGLAVAITYDGSPTAPSAAGSYSIGATVTDANHTGSSTGTLVISNNLVVEASESISLPDSTSTYANLLNDGTLTFNAGTVNISGDATNHGVLRLTGDAVLNVAGSFTNTGVIDIINWSGTLPPGLINSGTILDRSAIKVTSTGSTATTFSLSVPSYEGHLYQLETKIDLSAAWQPLGTPIAGTGSATNPPALLFTPALDGPRRFYRVVVTPAP